MFRDIWDEGRSAVDRNVFSQAALVLWIATFMCRIVHHPQAEECALQSRCIDTKNEAVPLHCSPRFKRVRVSARILNAKKCVYVFTRNAPSRSAT